jgi:hypothetical protein
MKKILLILALPIFCLGCESPDEIYRFNYDKFNKIINDTIRLNDNHLYYSIRTHSGDQPIHSQYCNCKNTLK